MVKAILFDFDGTLADTLPVCIKAFQHVFESYDQRTLTDKEVKAMFGPSETGMIRENLKHQHIDQAIETYYEMYNMWHEQMVSPQQDIITLLTYLKNEGYLLGIVTGKARRSLDLSLESLKLSTFFDTMITGDDVKKAKPHPEGILMAMEELSLKEDETLFLGDSDADLIAGKAAGIQTVAVYWLTDYQPVLTEEADTTIYHVDELYTYLNGQTL